MVDKAPLLSIRIDFWILLSDTICQLNQFHTISEAAMLSTPAKTGVVPLFYDSDSYIAHLSLSTVQIIQGFFTGSQK